MKIVLSDNILDKQPYSPGKLVVKLLPEEKDSFLFSGGADFDGSSSKQSFLARCSLISVNGQVPPENSGICIFVISPHDPEIQTPEGTFYVLDQSSIVLFCE